MDDTVCSKDWREVAGSSAPPFSYSLEESRELHELERVRKQQQYVPATKQMRELIDALKPGSVTESRKEMHQLLERIIKEMQCR